MTKKEKTIIKLTRLMQSYQNSQYKIETPIESMNISTIVYDELSKNNIMTLDDILTSNVTRLTRILKKNSYLSNLYYACRSSLKLNSDINIKVATIPVLIDSLNELDDCDLKKEIDYSTIKNIRLQNALNKANIFTYKDLCVFGDYTKIKNIGKLSVDVLEKHLDYFINKHKYKKEIKIEEPKEDKEYLKKFCENIGKVVVQTENDYDYSILQKISSSIIFGTIKKHLAIEEIRLLKRKFVDLETYNIIAKEENCTKQNVSSKIDRILQKVYELYSRDNFDNREMEDLLGYINYIPLDLLYGYVTYVLKNKNLDSNIIKGLLNFYHVDITKINVIEKNDLCNLTETAQIIFEVIKNIINLSKYLTINELRNFISGSTYIKTDKKNIKGYGILQIKKNNMLPFLFELQDNGMINLFVNYKGTLCVELTKNEE